jgi:hypothetical protein
VFNHNLPRGFVRVVQGVFAAIALFPSKHHHALGDAHAADGFFAGVLVHGDAHGRIRCVGNQPSFRRMNGFDHSFSGERIAVYDVKGAGIEGESAGVGQPEGASDFLRPFIPE